MNKHTFLAVLLILGVMINVEAQAQPDYIQSRYSKESY